LPQSFNLTKDEGYGKAQDVTSLFTCFAQAELDRPFKS
jgi:hypothetical protein